MKKLYYFYTLSTTKDISNIRYVGVTTRTLKQRLSGHKYCALHKNKRSTAVHKWMYSEYLAGNDIIISQIDCCEEAVWEETEKYWIKEYQNKEFKLLNIQKGGSGIVTKEMRNKEGLQRSIDAHKIPVYALDDNLNVVLEFSSAVEAIRFFGGKSKTAISNAISKNVSTKKSFGYYWVKQNDYKNGNFYVNTTPNFESFKKKVYQFDKNGTFVKMHESIKSIERYYNIQNSSPLRHAIRKKRLYKNSFWSFEKEADFDLNSPFRFFEIDKNENIIDRYLKVEDILKKYNCSSNFLYKKDKNTKGILPNGNKIIKNKNYK